MGIRFPSRCPPPPARAPARAVPTITQLVHDKLQAGEPLGQVTQFAVREAINTRNSHDNVSVVLASLG